MSFRVTPRSPDRLLKNSAAFANKAWTVSLCRCLDPHRRWWGIGKLCQPTQIRCRIIARVATSLPAVAARMAIRDSVINFLVKRSVVPQHSIVRSSLSGAIDCL
ncbi:hypothetical protein ACVWXM_009674 [Bradyrhizobium sp. GM7.3]